jgi:lysophospholipase L1-like esterase
MDIAGASVLIIGDSLSATPASPGAAFGRELGAAGADVTVNGRVSRSAYNFFTREGGAEQLVAAAAAKPTVVFVMLGSNDIGLNMSVDAGYMMRIRDAFPDAEVWGIGPPTFPASAARYHAGAAKVVTMMRDVFGQRFIDLRPLTADMVPAGSRFRSPDGVHFTAAGGAELGKRLAAEATGGGGIAKVLLGAALGVGVFWLLFR